MRISGYVNLVAGTVYDLIVECFLSKPGSVFMASIWQGLVIYGAEVRNLVEVNNKWRRRKYAR